MRDALLAHAFVLAGWLTFAPAFLGWGLGVRRAIVRTPHRSSIAARDLTTCFFMGYAIAVLIAQLANFVVPITAAVTIGFLIVGWLALVPSAGALASTIKRCVRARPLTVALLALAALWLANRGIGPADAHDTGLYHFNVIRWASEHPAVPGLGNLAGALALNNSSLLVHAMVDQGPFDTRAHHFLPSLLVLVFAARCLPAFLRLLKGSPIRPHTAFDATLLPLVVFLAFQKDICNPRTDMPAGLTLLVMMSELILLLRPISAQHETDQTDPDTANQRSAQLVWRTIVITTLASAAVTLKLSAAPMALAAWLVAACVVAKRLPLPRTMRTAIACVALSTLLVAPWLARNAIMSGHLLFPSTAVSIDADWTVPDEDAHWLSTIISTDTRAEIPKFVHGAVAPKIDSTPLAFYADLMEPPYEDTAEATDLRWIRPWLFTLPISAPVEVVFPAACFILCALLLAFASRPRGQHIGRHFLLAMLPPLAGLALWIYAPGPRYAWPIFWSMLGVALAWWTLVPRARIRPLRVMTTLIVLAASLAATGYAAFRVSLVSRGSPLAQIPFQLPHSPGGLHPTPTRDLTTFTTRSGLEIYVPDRTGEDQTELVWDSPLPAVAWPAVDPRLELRDPDDLSRGFRIDPDAEPSLRPAR